MVRKIWNFFYKSILGREASSINQAAFLLGLFSLLSQIVGLMRDRFLAHIFGAGQELDIYYAAFRVPDFLFVTVASVVSLSVLIPFIIEKEGIGREALRKFIDSIFTFFSLVMCIAALSAYILMPWLSHVLFTGFESEALARIIFMSRILLLSPIILGFSNLFGSLTQAYNRFTIYAVAPILYNVGILVGIMCFSTEWGVLGAVVGVIFGALMHLFVQVPFVWKDGLMPRIAWKPEWKLVERVAKISLPRTLTLSMSALTFIFLTALASRMAGGSVSIIALSNNLQTISLSLIGVSYSLAAFPTLTRRFQEKNIPAFLEQMQVTTRFIVFWSLPLTALLVVLRAQIVRVLLGSGLFDWSATRLTAAALALFVLSSVFQSLLLLFMRGFYSAGFTKKPFYINLFSTAVLVAVTYGLVDLFTSSTIFSSFITTLLKVDDLGNGVMLMLPLGFSMGTIVNTLVLWYFFERDFPGYSRALWRVWFEGLGASVVMGAVAYAGLTYFGSLFALDTLLNVFLQGFLAGLLGIAAGILVLMLLKSQELASVSQVVRSKFWRTKVIATDPEIV